MLEGPDACQPSPSLSRFLPRDLQSPELCPSETQMLQRGTPYTRSPGQPPLPSKSGEHPHLEHSFQFNIILFLSSMACRWMSARAQNSWDLLHARFPRLPS